MTRCLIVVQVLFAEKPHKSVGVNLKLCFLSVHHAPSDLGGQQIYHYVTENKTSVDITIIPHVVYMWRDQAGCNNLGKLAARE